MPVLCTSYVMSTRRLGLGLACILVLWVGRISGQDPNMGMLPEVVKRRAGTLHMQVPRHKTNTEHVSLTLRAEYILTHGTDTLPALELAALCSMPCSRRNTRHACQTRGACWIITCNVGVGGTRYTGSGTCRNCMSGCRCQVEAPVPARPAHSSTGAAPPGVQTAA